MPDPRKIAKQWLDTDAAFGVAEVPLKKPEARSRKPEVAIRTPEAPARTATVIAAPKPQPPQTAFSLHYDNHGPPRPIRQESPARAALGEMARAKKVAASAVVIPIEPFADLVVLTHEEKIDRLRLLEEHALNELSAYINEISTRLVFGEGDPDAALMFVGEGPGAEEDRTGRPFVGKSGQLLDKMITAIGLQRQRVYIGNVVKLRAADPDENGRLKDRPPSPDEVGRGLPYLHKQIEIIRPRVIVTLGGPAIKHLTGETQGVMSIRGQWRNFRGIPVMPTYHPAFVLRSYTEENRRKVWMDLQAAAKRAAQG